MKLTVVTYTGFKAAVTALGAASHILYESTLDVKKIVATYASGDVVYMEINPSGTGVAPATVVADYAAAVAVLGLFSVEV